MNAFKFIKDDFRKHLEMNKIQADHTSINMHFDKYFDDTFRQIEFEAKSDNKLREDIAKEQSWKFVIESIVAISLVDEACFVVYPHQLFKI